MRKVIFIFLVIGVIRADAGIFDSLSADQLPPFPDQKCIGLGIDECSKELGYRFQNIPITNPREACVGFKSSCKQVSTQIHNRCSSESHLFVEADGKINGVIMTYFNTFQARCRGVYDPEIPTVEALTKGIRPKFIFKADGGAAATFTELVGVWERDGNVVKVNALCKIMGMKDGKLELEFFRRCPVIRVIQAPCENKKCDLTNFKKAQQMDY